LFFYGKTVFDTLYMISKKLRLAVIPSDPLAAYSHKSDKYLKGYFNPLLMFDEVFVFSPLEDEEYYKAGMKIVPTTTREFKRRLIDYKIDLVRAYGGYWACDMVCKNKTNGIPVVVSVHDVRPEMLHNPIKKADVVFCVSEAVKKLVSTKFIKSARVWILPNRVDFDVMYPHTENKSRTLNRKYPSKYRILYVGRKSAEKNLDTLIKSLSILGREYCLIAVGKGNIKEYLQLAKEHGVREQCYFIESIPNEELPPYYSWADCMCVPSRWEGFGIVFIEALACESVVVTSDIEPMNEYIKHKKNGLLIKDYENHQALAKTIRVACNDKQLRKHIKRNARKSVEKFEKTRIEKLERSYYERILSLKLHKSNHWEKIWSFLKLH
jgi:glycosyltransferase involved in cell wall biosynthesis